MSRPSPKSIYVLYVAAISLFALAVAALSLFGFRDIFLTKEAIALIIVALFGPLVPFTKRIVFPGGKADFNIDDRDRIHSEIPKTLRDATLAIIKFDPEAILDPSASGAEKE